MDRRPQPKETEDDLLKQQAEFLSSTIRPSAKVIHEDKRSADCERESQSNAEKRFKRTPIEDSQETNISDGASSHLLSDVLEREIKNVITAAPRPQNVAFPTVPRITNTAHSGKGKSLFARHVASLKGSVAVTVKNLHSDRDHYFGNVSVILDGDSFEDKTVVEEIHRENVQKLSSMNEEEILREKNQLLKTLDPNLIGFLKEKRKQKNFEAKSKSCDQHKQNNHCKFQKCSSNNDFVLVTNNETKMDVSDATLDNYSKNNDKELIEENMNNRTIDIDGKLVDEDKLPIKPNEAKKWLHMDYVEHEKLQWMIDSPESKEEKIQSGYSARFDFDGALLSRNEEIPTYVGLHHHAEEPDIPGYTLEELLQYSRSSVSQQRILGLRILANVIKKSSTGIYDEHLELSILPQLIDAGILLMLRWAIDDDTEAVREIALQALNAILVVPADEMCLDRTFFWYRGYEMPFLKLHDKLGDDEGTPMKDDKELIDAELLKIDAIKGLLRIDILPRFRYILKTYHPPPPVVISILEILICISRHSLESASAVFRSQDLIQFIIINFIPKHWISSEGKTVHDTYGVPVPEAVKLIRILASAGRTIAKTLVTQFEIMDTIISYILLEPSDDRLPLKETLQLILESFSTWKMLLLYGFCSEYYVDIFPLLMQKLQSCQQISLANSKSSNDFDFKYYSALFSALESIVQIASFHLNPNKFNKNSGDQSCIPPSVTWQQVTGLVQPIFLCVEKWLFELMTGGELSFSALEMIGSALSFLSSFFDYVTSLPSFQIVDTFVCIESVWLKILIPFLQCPNWRKLTDSLIKCSNLLSRKQPGTLRDSSSLSTIGSLLWGGSLCPVLEVDGTVHFLTTFLRFVNTIMKLCKNLDEKAATLILCDEVINDYIKRLITADRCLAFNWFTRYETHFIYYFLKLDIMKNQSDALLSLHHHLAIIFISLVSSGDEYLVKDIMKMIVFNPIYLKNENIISYFTSLSFGETSSQHMQSTMKNFNIQEVLPKMLEIYLNILETNFKLNKEISEKLHPHEYSKMVIQRKSEMLLPVDWIYLPLKFIFLKKLQYNLDDVQHTLQWLFILYSWRRDALKNIPVLDFYCYLACIFLIGNDIFLENKIRPYLEELISCLLEMEKKEKFNMKNPIPVATSFRDLYLQFLTQFEAVSYGDHLFGLMILLPLQQQYDQQLRIDLWTSHTISLRLLSLPIQTFPLSLQCYLNPLECNKWLLISYYQNIFSSFVNPVSCPILYLIVVHHLHHFLYGKTEIYPKMKLAMLNNFNNSKNEVVKQHIHSYGGLNIDIPLGFHLIS